MITRGTGYVKGSHPKMQAQLREHIRYLEHRERGEEARAVFGKEEDSVSRGEAMKDIEAHSDRYVAYHKIVLSPSAEEREGITDWQQWTRDVMKDFSERKSKDLTWYAVKHDNTNDPHVHVVLAGSGIRADGETATVKLYPRDFQALRDIGAERSQVEHIRLARAEIGEQDRLEARELGIALPTQAEPDRPTHPDPALPSNAASPAASAPPTPAKADAPDANKATAPDTPSAPPEMPSLLPLARVVTKPIIDIDR